MWDAYGKKPAAKKQAQEDESDEEDNEASVEEEPRTAAQIMLTRFDAPSLVDVMETVWMQYFNGTTLCTLEVKKAIPGSRWPLIWHQPAQGCSTPCDC